ncbi:MAG: hypothetical protein ACOH1I_04495 [Gallionellaceae bacterium]|jgi:hypothetical protein
MFSRKLRRIVILLSAVMLMSSQYAVASYACPKMVPMDMPAMDITGKDFSGMSAECMHEMESASAPLCKAHCEQTPQSSEVPSISFAPFTVQTQWSLVYQDALEPASSRAYGNSPVWQTDASPPLRIQFQVFRI